MLKLSEGSLFLIQPREVVRNDKVVNATPEQSERVRKFCADYAKLRDDKSIKNHWSYRETPKTKENGERLFMTGALGQDLSFLMDKLDDTSREEVLNQLRPHALNIVI